MLEPQALGEGRARVSHQLKPHLRGISQRRLPFWQQDRLNGYKRVELPTKDYTLSDHFQVIRYGIALLFETATMPKHNHLTSQLIHRLTP